MKLEPKMKMKTLDGTSKMCIEKETIFNNKVTETKKEKKCSLINFQFSSNG